MATHKRKFAKPVYDTNQPPIFRPVDYKGKGITDERARLTWHPNGLRRRASALFAHPGPTVPDIIDALDLTDYKGKGTTNERTRLLSHPNGLRRRTSTLFLYPSPPIPDTINALDLATYNNPLQYVRTHKPHGKLKQKKNARRMSTEHRKNGPPVAMRDGKLPRCRVGTRRMLDHPRDDLERKICWFHKQRMFRWSDDCRWR